MLTLVDPSVVTRMSYYFSNSICHYERVGAREIEIGLNEVKISGLNFIKY